VHFIALQEECDYFVAAPEVGAQGTPHIQFYLAFKKKKTFAFVAKATQKKARLFIKRGTCKQASDYCLKGEFSWVKGVDNSLDPLFGLNLSPDTIVFGVLPKEQQEAGGAAASEVWADNIELALSGRIEEITPMHRVLHYHRYEQLVERNKPKPKRLTWRRGESPNLWIYGPTGTGKSHKARELYPDLYEKMLNKWWENYNDEDEVLLEDVGESHASWIGDFIKIWADIYPFRNECKYGSKMLRPKVIIVTSNYHPKELFPAPNVHLPILDRFKLMELTEKYDYPDEVPEGGPVLEVAPRENFPMFDVVREMFAVEDADDIPLGPIPKLPGVYPVYGWSGRVIGLDDRPHDRYGSSNDSSEESEIDVVNFSQ